MKVKRNPNMKPIRFPRIHSPLWLENERTAYDAEYRRQRRLFFILWLPLALASLAYLAHTILSAQ